MFISISIYATDNNHKMICLLIVMVKGNGIETSWFHQTPQRIKCLVWTIGPPQWQMVSK